MVGVTGDGDGSGDRDAPSGDTDVPSGEAADAPLSDLAASVGERRDQQEPDRFDELFSEQGFEEVDEGAIWEATEETETSEFGAIGEVIEEGEETFVVSKRNFCERCRHFSEPPAVHCTHDGTEIREFVDMDHVRVYSCPIVEERGLTDDPSAH